MRRWLATSEAARLVEMMGKTPNTFRKAVARGELGQGQGNGVLRIQRGNRTMWCAEALWKWHLTGSAEGCWELDDILAFVATHPLPDEQTAVAS